MIFELTADGWQNMDTGEIATGGIRLDTHDVKAMRNRYRLDRIELRVGSVYYVSGCCAIYINDRLHSVTHPNPYKDESPACVIHASDMARKQAEILTTLETVKETQ